MKTVILYSTKHGTVEKAVKLLNKELGESVISYRMKKNIPLSLSLNDFDLVILGGSIYMGNIQKEIRNFIKQNLDILLTKRVGLFICAGHPNPIEIQKEWENAFPKELYNHAIVKENIGYEFDFNKMSFLEKAMIKKIHGIKESQFALSNETITHFARKCLL